MKATVKLNLHPLNLTHGHVTKSGARWAEAHLKNL